MAVTAEISVNTVTSGTQYLSVIEGDDEDNFINGTSGDDLIYAHGGNDRVNASGGDDQVHGGDGRDVLAGQEGDDHLFGGDGNDTLRGEAGNGYSGPSGDDVLVGGAGDDLMYGGGGVDFYDGGEGFDRVSFIMLAATQGVVANLATQTVGNDGFGNAETMVSIEALGAGTAFADHFTGDNQANFLLGDTGDILFGSGGDDGFQLVGAPTLVDGGAGIDTITGFFGELGTLVPDNNGDGLADFVFATHGVNVDLGLGAIIDDGFGQSGTITGIENVGGSALADRLVGNSGANTLSGADGNDWIAGGKGDDVLDGGGGADVLTGGAQVDRFEFGPESGHDRITDFDKKAEVIAILGVPGVDAIDDLTFTAVGKDTLIGWSGGAASVLMVGLKPNAFTAANFDFGTTALMEIDLSGAALVEAASRPSEPIDLTMAHPV